MFYNQIMEIDNVCHYYDQEELKMKVINKNGTAIDFDVAVSMMDEGIRESVSRWFSPCSEQEFFTAYITV